MSVPTMTTEQIVDNLRERALKVCQLSLEITTRGLAQAFAEVHGHTNHVSAVIRPVDAIIPEDESPRPEIAFLRLRLYEYDFLDQEQKEEDFLEQVTDADRYIAYLEQLLAQGKAITLAAIRGAA